MYFLLLNISAANAKLGVFTVEEPPMSFTNKNGRVSGYSTSIVRTILAKANIQADIEIVPEARAIDMAKSNQEILLFSFSRTPNREDDFYWIGELYRKDWMIYSLNSTPHHIKTIDDLRELEAIGVVRGDVREEWLLNKGFDNLVSLTHHQQSVQMLLKQRLPVIAYGSAGIISTCQTLTLNCKKIKPILKLHQSSAYLLLSKTSMSLKHRAKLRTAYKALLHSGQMMAITKRWHDKLNKQNITVKIASDKPILQF